ncbi:MAG: nitrate/nitrite transporter NrtS [Chloroflexales bacterium]|nr:nitrate/nitrite transporter NrtS [Chloroflexales bacterium]
MHEWLAIAREPAVVHRARRIALIVGTLLITINHGDALLHGELSLLRLGQMALTVLVPYCVSTISSVGVLRELRRDSAR